MLPHSGRKAEEVLRQWLNGTPDRSHYELSSVRTVIFVYERTSPALTSQSKLIQQDEIEREVQAYQAYLDSFSHEEAVKRRIAYAVISAESNFDFTNLDRWYERDAGVRVEFILFIV